MKQLFSLEIFGKGSIPTLVAMLLALIANGQSGKLSGVIYDEQRQVVTGASVSIGDAVPVQISDRSGKFTFSNLQPGTYILKVTHVGYATYIESIQLKRQPAEVVIQLTPQSTQLDNVTVIGKTENQRVREQPIRAVVINTRAVAEQPTTLAELMNRSPGIRIRQSGGLGNAVDVSINGFQGNAVQYFRDGIPIEYLGGGYGINNIPINLLERAEVYTRDHVAG